MTINETVNRLWTSFKDILPVRYFDSYQQLEDYVMTYVKSGNYDFHLKYASRGDAGFEWTNHKRNIPDVPASMIMALLPESLYKDWGSSITRYRVLRTPFGIRISFMLAGLDTIYPHTVGISRNYLSKPAASPASADC